MHLGVASLALPTSAAKPPIPAVRCPTLAISVCNPGPSRAARLVRGLHKRRLLCQGYFQGRCGCDVLGVFARLSRVSRRGLSYLQPRTATSPVMAVVTPALTVRPQGWKACTPTTGSDLPSSRRN